MSVHADQLVSGHFATAVEHLGWINRSSGIGEMRLVLIGENDNLSRPFAMVAGFERFPIVFAGDFGRGSAASGRLARGADRPRRRTAPDFMPGITVATSSPRMSACIRGVRQNSNRRCGSRAGEPLMICCG